MTRFWNLKAQFVGVLVLLLLGSLAAQAYVHERSKERLRVEVVAMTSDLADEVTQKVPKVLVFEPWRIDIRGLQLREVRWPNKLWMAPRPGTLQLDTRRMVQLVTEAFQASGQRISAFEHLDLPSEVAERLREMEYDSRILPPQFLPEAPRPQMLAIFGVSAMSVSPQQDAEAPLAGAPPSARGLSSGSRTAVAQSQPIQNIDLTSYTDRLEAVFEENRRQELLATLGIFLLGIGLAWFLGVHMTRPVTTLASGFQKLSDGDLAVTVPDRGSSEFGLLGRQFNAMVHCLRQHRELQRELELRERIQHMGDLAAGVAHDVRNPLNAIHLNIGQIRDEFLPTDGPSQDRFLRFTSDVQREVERLNQLVTNFLSLAQPSSGDCEEVAVNELLADLARLLAKEATARHVELSTHLDGELPSVRADRQELRNAFLNIAMNALQAMEPRGRGTLDLATGRRVRADGCTEVAISFVDSGVGMGTELLEKVFIPYYTTRPGGTGLGLPIARRIAERHGGRLEVRSQEGVGTTVSFLFPVAPATADRDTLTGREVA